ncbi:hypothetical protein CCACVL1_22925 [Corchorus capsularis]|uniref:Uncharacterized protein n=1 Tax=Corchorus capsularis TaxID=210143 RepID=A0A1R3GVZ8_COCAP|nr:hypothetical protein CCACVL1_22925 [Corchorus capsularis]
MKMENQRSSGGCGPTKNLVHWDQEQLYQALKECPVVDVKRSIDDGEKLFNQLSIEERAKFDEETLVNVDNIRTQSTRSQKATGFSNEYMVITILVAAEGEHKLPPINGSKDLKEALLKLACILTKKILGVEVLWTPQDENDTLSKKELIEDYPELRPL